MESNKQFNLNGWYEFASSPAYIDWAAGINKQHHDDIQWMLNRTNRLSFHMVKNARALAAEHGWLSSKEMYDKMLKDFS